MENYKIRVRKTGAGGLRIMIPSLIAEIIGIEAGDIVGVEIWKQ